MKQVATHETRHNTPVGFYCQRDEGTLSGTHLYNRKCHLRWLHESV